MVLNKRILLKFQADLLAADYKIRLPNMLN
jgi:hypothetical protein